MTSKLQEKPAAIKTEDRALQNMQILHFFVGLFVLLNPVWKPNSQFGSGSSKPISIRIQNNEFDIDEKNNGIVLGTRVKLTTKSILSNRSSPNLSIIHKVPYPALYKNLNLQKVYS
jgi:hypothetical protein